jgi:ABC-type branched-subunit amino acid transport system substrate-binding protein
VYTISHAFTPVRIGVLLPLTGDVEAKEPLEWAKENINREGGIGGRPVEFVYKDTGKGDYTRLAQELLDDSSVSIVIGPQASDEVFALAPAFAEREKVLISPYATSGDLSRAFGSTGYFWRTTQGDVAQIKVILSILRSRGVQRIGLLAENTTYGDTFYDWTGFFAIESGIDLVSIRRFDRGSPVLETETEHVLSADPEYIIAVCRPADAAVIKRAIDRSGKTARLFLTDSAASRPLVTGLGPAAEGIEGTTPAADPASGFVVAYQEKFGHAPEGYAATVYDAVLLAAYTAARQDTAFLESPADSLRRVVYGNGTATGWDAQGIHDTIAAIRAGEQPDITGASGPLRYDREFGVDPLAASYSHWVVEDGDIRVVATVSSAKTGSAAPGGASVSRSHATSSFRSETGRAASAYTPAAERTDFRAVIVGPSRGWNNYRHQSDALAMYSLLRENGVSDDHIILMVYDDIPRLPQNPLRGDVHNVPKGKNLRPAATADYTGPDVSAVTLKNVLLGRAGGSTPVVLESTESTDVFVYIASHGEPGGIIFSDYRSPFTTADFAEVAGTMSREGRYRRIVYMVDTCFGESIALNASEKGLLYFTGAAASEPSLGAVYDPDISQWLSDEFTENVLRAVEADPDITIRELYVTTYDRVTGSHVRLLNAENFGTIDRPFLEFIRP